MNHINCVLQKTDPAGKPTFSAHPGIYFVYISFCIIFIHIHFFLQLDSHPKINTQDND